MRLKTLYKTATVTTFVLSFGLCHTANILFFHGLSTYSHRLMAWPLVEALLERNHTITFFQPDKHKTPNPQVKEVNPNIGSVSEQVDFLQERLTLGHRKLLFKIIHVLPQLGVKFCDTFLSDKKVVEWIKNSKYDLIFIDGLYNECAYGIAHLHKAKTILFSTTHPLSWFPDVLGYPAETATVPALHFAFDIPLRFADRVWTTVATLYYLVLRGYLLPSVEKTLREKLDMPNMPSLPELVANTSAVFTNTHFSEEVARSHPPNVISIGGMNCKEKNDLNPIPKHILDFINGAGDEGFILVSFGSGAKISSAPKQVQEVFFRAFKNIKIRVLWKWEGERPKDMPANVMTVKWFPQQDILGHQKARAFIFHGGLLSMHEAICHQVPQIVFPVFAEQDYNGERLQRTGRGIRLEIQTITQEKLEEAIKKVLYDESYKKNVMEVSQRFMDRPQKPIETAVWWTEYVLRQNDTNFMRPTGTHLTWYERRLLDVWAFLLLVVVVFIYTSLRIGSSLMKVLLRRLVQNKGFARSSDKMKLN